MLQCAVPEMLPQHQVTERKRCFRRKKGITCLLYNDMVYMLKEKRTEVLFSKVKEDRKPLSIKASSLAFQTAPKAAVTEKHRLVYDQNISCPPVKETVKVLRSC